MSARTAPLTKPLTRAISAALDGVGGLAVRSAAAEVTGATEITFTLTTSYAYAGVEWGVSPDYTFAAFDALQATSRTIVIDAADGVAVGTTYAWRSYVTNDPLDAVENRVYGAGGTVATEAAGDPHFANVSLLAINDNAADGTTVFDDQSSNNLTITTINSAQYDNVSPPTGMTTTMLSDGTTDGLSVADNALFGFGTGDFTVEMMVKKNTTQTTTVFDTRSAATQVRPALYINTTGSPRFFVNGADVITGGNVIPTGTWYHLAICRASGSTRMFVDGVQTGSTYADSNNYGASLPCYIGANYNSASQSINGWMACFRVTKGVARYTADFTPPTLPLDSA